MNTTAQNELTDSLSGSRSRQRRLPLRWLMLAAVGVIIVLCFGILILPTFITQSWLNINSTTRSVSGPICGVWQTISVPSVGPLTCCIQFNGLTARTEEDIW